jgi:hypothetical protein
MEWGLKPGDRLPRSKVHDLYGGNRRRGIAPSRKTENVLLFSSRAAASKYGYQDDLDADPVEYFGEGQRGDQAITHGNRAILRHQEDRRALRLFRVEGTTVEYVGEFQIDEEEPYRWVAANQTGEGGLRKALLFRLHAVEEESGTLVEPRTPRPRWQF